MDVTGFAAGYKRLWSDHVRRLTDPAKFGLGQRAQFVTRRLQIKFASGGTKVSPEMDPSGTTFRGRTFPARSARHEIIETEMAKLVTAIGGEDHIASWRGGDQRVQCFEPADKATAPLGGRLPP
jgi:hypothetical protein